MTDQVGLPRFHRQVEISKVVRRSSDTLDGEAKVGGGFEVAGRRGECTARSGRRRAGDVQTGDG